MNTDLKQILRERGLTQKIISDRLAVSEPTVSEWVNALRRGNPQRIPAERVKPLAVLLGISPHILRPDLFDAPTDTRAEVAA